MSTETKRMSYDEALAAIQDPSRGLVRIEGHSATNKEQLDELFNVILPKHDDGTYGRTQQETDREAYKESYLQANGGSMALMGAAGEIPTGSRPDPKLLKENADLKARMADMEAKFNALMEQLGEKTETPADPTAAESGTPAEGK